MSSALISLKKLLIANSLLCALLSFAACRNIVSPAAAAIFLPALAASVFIDAFGWKRPPRYLLNLVSVIAVGSAMALVRIDSVIETFLSAVLLLTAVKMLEDKRARDHVQIVILSVITIVSAAALTFRPEFVMYYIVMSVLIAQGLLLSTLFSKAPEMVFNRKEALCLCRRALAIWLMMLPVCAALFFAAPRARAALTMPGYGAGDTTASGFVDRVTHGLIGRIQESNEIAFRAETPRVAANDLYWRGLTLSVFDGNEWRARQIRGPRHVDYAASGNHVRQEIFLEQGQFRVLFALDKPLTLDKIDFIYASDGVFLRSNRRMTRQLSYGAVSAVSAVMRPNDAAFDKEPYLSLPPGFSPPLRDLTDGLTQGLDERSKISAIQGYLSPPAFSYSLDNLPVSDNALEEFVLDIKKGNCEYFASAMAVMCRMAGIPSRLVAGYRGGYYNVSGEYYIVRQKNAHAWVELWDSAEKAWRRRDPTPPDESVEISLRQRETGRFAMYLDLLSLRVSQLIVEYGGDEQMELIERFKGFLLNPGASFQSAAGNMKDTLRRRALPIFAVMIVLIAVLLAMRAGRFSKRSPEAALLRDFLSATSRRGFTKRPDEGLEEFANTIPETDARELRELAWRFVVAFEQDYYRDRPMTAAKLSELKEIVQQIKRASKNSSNDLL